MTPLLFDIIIVALLVLSAGLGFMRGFCNEVFTIFGWMGAVIATIYFTPVAREFGRTLIKKPWLADIATAGAIFIVTLGVFSVVSHFATRTLHASKLNIVDRTLGFCFGVLRGIVLLGLTFYLFTFVFADPNQRPEFIEHAKTRPFLEASASWAEVFLPKEMKDKSVEGLDQLADKKDKMTAEEILAGQKDDTGKDEQTKIDSLAPSADDKDLKDKKDSDITKDDLMNAKTKLQNIIELNAAQKKKQENE